MKLSRASIRYARGVDSFLDYVFANGKKFHVCVESAIIFIEKREI